MQRSRGKNRVGKSRDLFKKIGDIRGIFHAWMGMRTDRNGEDLIEAEEIKKRWYESTNELQTRWDNHTKKWDNHYSVVTLLEPDILECEIKWAIRSITQTKLIEVTAF